MQKRYLKYVGHFVEMNVGLYNEITQIMVTHIKNIIVYQKYTVIFNFLIHLKNNVKILHVILNCTYYLYA